MKKTRTKNKVRMPAAKKTAPHKKPVVKRKPFATVDEISDYLNITPRMVNRHVKEDGMPRVGRGDYDLKKCVRWYIDHLQARIDEARRGSETEQQARARLLAAQANVKEIELARLRAEVINIDDALKEVESALMAVRSQFLSQPKSSALALSTLTSVKEIEAYLYARTVESLSEAASLPERIQRIAQAQGKTLGEGEAPGASTVADSQPVGGRVPVPERGGLGAGGQVAEPAVSARNHGRNKRSKG